MALYVDRGHNTYVAGPTINSVQQRCQASGVYYVLIVVCIAHIKQSRPIRCTQPFDTSRGPDVVRQAFDKDEESLARMTAPLWDRRAQL
jgi:hypothetical protein